MEELASYTGVYEYNETLYYTELREAWNNHAADLQIARLGWTVDELWIATTGSDYTSSDNYETTLEAMCMATVAMNHPWVCLDPVVDESVVTVYPAEFLEGWYQVDTDTDEIATCADMISILPTFMAVTESQVSAWCTQYSSDGQTILISESYQWYVEVVEDS